MKMTVIKEDLNTNTFVTPHGRISGMELFMFCGIDNIKFEVAHEMADRLISGAWFKEIDDAIVKAQSLGHDEVVMILKNQRHEKRFEVLGLMTINLVDVYKGGSQSLKDAVLLFIKELNSRDEIKPDDKIDIQKVFDYIINEDNFEE